MSLTAKISFLVISQGIGVWFVMAGGELFSLKPGLHDRLYVPVEWRGVVGWILFLSGLASVASGFVAATYFGTHPDLSAT
jgi:hypothetical protein